MSIYLSIDSNNFFEFTQPYVHLLSTNAHTQVGDDKVGSLFKKKKSLFSTQHRLQSTCSISAG